MITAKFDTKTGSGAASGKSDRYSIDGVELTGGEEEGSGWAATTDGHQCAIRRVEMTGLKQGHTQVIPARVAGRGTVRQIAADTWLVTPHGRRQESEIKADVDCENFPPLKDVIPDAQGRSWVTVDADLLAKMARAMAMAGEGEGNGNGKAAHPVIHLGVAENANWNPLQPIIALSGDGRGMGVLMPSSRCDHHAAVSEFEALRREFKGDCSFSLGDGV